MTSSSIRASRSARSRASVSRAASRCSAAVSGWRAGLRLPVPLLRAAGAAGVGEVVVDGGAGAFEGAVYGFLGGAEHLGDFGGVVAQDVAEDERGALAWGQQLQGGDEGQGDGLGGLVAGLRSGALVDEVVEQDVGVGFQPGRGVAGAGGFGQGGLGQRGGDAGASAVGAQHAQAPIGRDLVEPGPERGPLAELAEVTPGGHEGLLECVLGVLQGSQDAVAVHLQLAGVALDQVAERVVVAGPSPGDQVRRVHLHRHASSLFFFSAGRVRLAQR